MFFLADVLSAISAKTLSRQQRGLLCDFVLSRIAGDPESIEPSVHSLIGLESMGKWEDERAVEIFKALLESTNPLKQFKLQRQRYSVLQLIDILMAKYRAALREAQSSNPDLLEKLVFYFDGEKDPRNLMIVFSVLLVPMTEWDIAAHAQDFFEAVFNYFPITFKPPPDDPYGITAQQLKDRLRSCISATSFFAPYAFPALLDKLDSTSPNTKRDALQTISTCAGGYSTRTISLYSVNLWDALKFEVLNVQEEDLAEQALEAMSNVAAKLSGSQELHDYLKPVAKECNEHLEDAPTKQSQASGRIIQAIARASPEASNFLTRAVLPQIVSLFNAAGSLSKRRALLDVSLQLLHSNVAVFGEWRTSDLEFLQRTINSENALRDFSEQIQELLLGAVVYSPKEEVSYRILSINGLTELVKLRSLLQDQQISKTLHALTTVILKEPSYENDDLRLAAEAGLLEIAHQKPQLVVNEAFPLFLAELPEDVQSEESSGLSILAAFAKLGSEEKIFETVVMRLRNRLASAFQLPASGLFILALLNALLYTFVRGAYKELAVDVQSSYYNNVVIWLFEQITKKEDILKSLAERAAIYNAIGRVCRIIVLNQDAKIQQEIAGRMYNLQNQTGQDDLSRHDSLLISTHLLAALKADIPLPFAPLDLLRRLVALVKSNDTTAETTAASLAQMTLIINKHLPESDLKPVLDEAGLTKPDAESFSNASILDIRIEFAISKALLLRNSRLAPSKLSRLLDLLPDPTHGPTIARGFSTLLAPDEFLTPENHSRISKLHQQKLFSLTVPAIASASSRTAAAISPTAKQNYLLALAGLLHYLPYPILVPELPALVPLLLQSLDALESPALKASAIKTLSEVLAHDPEALAEHANSLASRLLRASRGGKGAKSEAAAGVRSAALACLARVPAVLRRETLVPLRTGVVRELTAALDDGKRGVRREAVRCRVAWIGLDDGDEE
ncbi:MAG: hypothetical protein Q9165_007648 [Trypethelium subeluteriae]